MKYKEIKPFYRQNLPHLQPIGASFFVTFRLKGSIPKAQLYGLKQTYEEAIAIIINEPSQFQDQLIEAVRKRFFSAYDQLLDTIKTGPHYLRDPDIADLVKQELHRFDGKLYELIAYCIMSNHVHLLIDTSIQIPEDLNVYTFEKMEFEPLQNIMKRIKGPSAVYANRLLKRQGKFWQRESYDRYIRNPKEFENVVGYILDNPVKAGLVKEWRDYPFSYLSRPGS